MDSRSALGMTRRYSALHSRFAQVAQATGLKPFEVRVVTAVYGRKGECVSDELERELLVEGSAVRRALVDLYRLGYLVGEADGGGPRGPGRRTRVRITETGLRLMVSVAGGGS